MKKMKATFCVTICSDFSFIFHFIIVLQSFHKRCPSERGLYDKVIEY